jgi:hypothetical protein
MLDPLPLGLVEIAHLLGGHRNTADQERSVLPDDAIINGGRLPHGIATT